MELKQRYQQTELGLLPEDWEVATIGDRAVKVGSGVTPTGGSRVYKTHGRHFLRSQNVGWGKLLLDDVSFIDDDIHARFPDTELQPGDVLLNITGASIGRSAVADDRVSGGNVNQHVCLIRTDSTRLIPAYLNLFLLSRPGQRQIDSFQAGGNRQGLNFGQVRSINVPVPSKSEQAAIAGALSDVDGLIGALDRLIAKKRDLKQAAMQQLLTGRTRLPGFKGKWESAALRQLIAIPVSDGPHMTPVFLSEGVPFLSVNNLVDGKVSINGLRHVSHEDHLEFARKCRPVRGDILLGKAASVGLVALVDFEWEFNVWSPIAVIRVNSQHVPAFFYYGLQERAVISQVKLFTNSSSQGNIGMGDIESLIFSFPTRDEQAAIVQVLSDMDAEISALESRREKTRLLKQAMMQALLTGRTRLV